MFLIPNFSVWSREMKLFYTATNEIIRTNYKAESQPAGALWQKRAHDDTDSRMAEKGAKAGSIGTSLR